MRYLLCLVPPLAVLCSGFKPRTFRSWASLFLNLFLSVAGYMPGVIHALFVVARAKRDKHEMERSAFLEHVENTGLASLETADIELFLLGAMAIWGDSKVTQKEMDFLLEKTKKNIKDLKLVAFTHRDDVELSCKEYLIELFSFIKTQEQNADEYADIGIPEKAIKKLQKKDQEFKPTVKQGIIFTLLGLLEASYGSDGVTRLSTFEDEMTALAKIDGEISDEESELLEIVKFQRGELGCGAFILVIAVLCLASYFMFRISGQL